MRQIHGVKASNKGGYTWSPHTKIKIKKKPFKGDQNFSRKIFVVSTAHARPIKSFYLGQSSKTIDNNFATELMGEHFLHPKDRKSKTNLEIEFFSKIKM